MKQTKKTEIHKKNDISRLFFPAVIIAAVVFFTYSSSLNNNFTNWDDEFMVVKNPMVYDLSIGGIIKIFSSFHHSHYHPLTTISYAIENAIGGMNPAVYHTTNVILHIINSILVLFFLYLLLRNVPFAFIGGLIFGLHPLHVESVAWITERKDVLYSLFFLGSIICYIYYRNINKKKFLNYSLILFLLAALSKANALMLPLILILIDYYYDKKFDLKKVKDKSIFFIISLVLGIVNIYAQYTYLFKGYNAELPEFSFPERLLIGTYNIIFYIYKFIFPVKLSAFYPYPDGLDILFYVSLLIIAAGIYVMIKYSRNTLINFSVLFFLIMLLPVLQFIPVGRAIASDRFMYLPMTGLILLLLYGLMQLRFFSFFKIKYVLYSLVGAILVFYTIMAYQQTKVWKDSHSLFSDVINKYPKAALAYNNRGTVYLDNGLLEQALTDFNNAVRYNPRYAAAYNNLGILYNRRTEYDKAIQNLEKSVSLNPNFPDAYFNMALSYQSKGDITKAVNLFEKTVQLSPEFAEAYNNLGNIAGSNGDHKNAVSYFSKAVKANPNYPKAWFNLGVSQLNSGDNISGIESIKNAARLGHKESIEYLNSQRIRF